jgi:hypothetical protein
MTLDSDAARAAPKSRVVHDRRLSDELDYCSPAGIPHSIFLGRPWPGPGEPLWTDEDRRKVLEWQADKRSHCSSCGQRQSDWLDEDGKEPRGPPFDVVETRCGGCEALGYHREDAKGSDDGAARHGIHLAFKRVCSGEDGQDLGLGS